MLIAAGVTGALLLFYLYLALWPFLWAKGQLPDAASTGCIALVGFVAVVLGVLLVVAVVFDISWLVTTISVIVMFPSALLLVGWLYSKYTKFRRREE